MAFLSLHVVYTVMDETNKKSTFRISFPNSTDIAVLQEFAWRTAELIDPLIKGKIVDIGISASVEFASADVKASPLVGSDVEDGAYFAFESASQFTSGFTVPTWDEAFIVSGSDNVDIVDADVDAFVDRITAGYTQLLTNVSPSDNRGSDLETLITAKESFRSTRR